ncbi:MAG: hypothetical protein PVF77_00680 [Anaerolineae bacterium]
MSGWRWTCALQVEPPEGRLRPVPQPHRRQVAVSHPGQVLDQEDVAIAHQGIGQGIALYLQRIDILVIADPVAGQLKCGGVR